MSNLYGAEKQNVTQASRITFNPSGSVTARNVQDAILEASETGGGTIPDNSITEPKYQTNSVSTRALAADSVTLAELAPGTRGGLITYNATGDPIEITGTTGQVAAVDALGDLVFGAVPIADGSITEPKYGTGSVSTRALEDNAVTNVKMADNAVDTVEIVDSAVTLPKMANGTTGGLITYALTTGAPAEITGTEGNVPTVQGDGSLKFDPPAGGTENDRQIFTASGTFNKSTLPISVQRIKVEVVGGGGGGGGANTTTSDRGSGGGGGGASIRWIPVSSLGATETVTVGTGGAAGTSGTTPTAGTAGNPSSFGAFCTGTGGGGGFAATGSGIGGGAGGVGTGGDINIAGGAGQTNLTGTSASASGGGMGAGGYGGAGSVDTTEIAGALYGGGGSCGNNAAAGAGANGIVVVTW